MDVKPLVLQLRIEGARADLLSLFVLGAPMRDKHKPLMNHIEDVSGWVWIGAVWIIALLAAWGSWLFARHSLALERAADADLKEYLNPAGQEAGAPAHDVHGRVAASPQPRPV